jgi:hypothetical protein
MNEIEKTEGEIKVLQAKLELLKEIEKHKSPAEEAFKEVYGYYPEVCERSVWVAFQKGYEAAQKDYKVGEYQPTSQEQEDNEWKSVALRFGEKLSGYLSDGYYELSPNAWFRWAVFTYGKHQQIKDAVRESVKWHREHQNESVEDYLTPQGPEQVDAGLRNAMRQAKKDGVFDEPTKPMNEVLDRLENKYKDAEENAASYMTDDVVNRMLKRWETDPPSFLRFELSRSLEDRIYRWWETCFVHHPEWSMEECVEDLLDIITLFLPGEQSAEGSQNIDTVVAVEAHNELLRKIKSKLRNKKA